MAASSTSHRKQGALGQRGRGVCGRQGWRDRFYPIDRKGECEIRITVNAVLPGPIRTPLVEKAIAQFGDKLRSDMEGLTLVKRLGEPEEVAAAVSFFASPSASFVTGEVLGVSGGMGCGAS
nr:SDR family oxidoreductase [Bradyrhizobium brasilense]